MTEERIIDLEIQTAHLTRTVEELNDVVARQGREIDALTRNVRLLLARLAEQEQEIGGGVAIGDRKPPHW